MTLLSILCTMGLPSIDDSLDKLLVAMETFPNVAVLGDAVSLARIIGLLLALCVGSYECWMMMLGRRGMDVMKLLRIVGISICISCSSYICSALQTPGKGLEATTKAMAKSKNKEVAAFELKVAQKQGQYLERLRAVQDSIATAQQVAAIGEDANWWDKLIYNVENLGNTINNYAQRAAVAAETKVSEWINDVIRFVGELIFQMSYYGILVAQRIFLAIMAIFCPIMFAMSLAPPWNSPLQSPAGYDRLRASAQRLGQLMVADRGIGPSGHRLQLYVRYGYASRRIYNTLCSGSRFMAHPRRC